MFVRKILVFLFFMEAMVNQGLDTEGRVGNPVERLEHGRARVQSNAEVSGCNISPLGIIIPYTSAALRRGIRPGVRSRASNAL